MVKNIVVDGCDFLKFCRIDPSDTDSFQRAILQHRNTPDPTTKVSPAMCVFGRHIRDFIPVLPGKYEPHPSWKETLTAREEALCIRHQKAAEKWTEHTRQLPPLAVGDHVRVQNQVGNNPTKWDRTGQVTEVHQYDQYTVRIDGSRRPTLRNRKFLRKFTPLHKQPEPRNITEDLKLLGTPFLPGLESSTNKHTHRPPPPPRGCHRLCLQLTRKCRNQHHHQDQ